MKKLATFFVVLFSLFAIRYSLFAREALAVCPICTVAVGAGLGFSRYLGIDDSVSGIWVGGLILSSSFWLIDYLKKKSPKFSIFNFQFLIILLMYIFVFLPLWKTSVIGHPFNTVLGIDKLIFGTILGTAAFLLGMFADKKVRQVKSKQLFAYQKVVFPVIALIVTSLVVYFYGGYLK
ncbi:MAG: hypothetical protein AAB535_04115 [Patescibacteria group bacterium]